MADPRFGERLEQIWDRVHALDDVPQPDPGFVKAVRDELLTATTAPMVADPSADRQPNGRAFAHLWQQWQEVLPSTPRRRWALAQLATALLLLLTLFVAYFVFGPGKPHPAVVPPIAPTPVSTPEAGLTIVPLAMGVADTLPDDPVWLMTFHSTFRPGGRFGLEPSEGPDLVAVTSGTMTYHADRPLVVTRAASGDAPATREMIPAGADAVLGAGDSVLIPLGANVSRQNDDAEAAVEVMAMLEGTFLGSRGRSGSSGVTDLPIVTFHISDAHTLPAAPVTITLSRVKLEPGARFTPPAASWWMVGAPEDAYHNLERQPTGAAVNTGPDAIELFLTTVEPLAGGTPSP